MNYLRRPYDIQGKKVPMLKKNASTTDMQLASIIIIIICMIFESHGVLVIFVPDRSGFGGARFPTNTTSPYGFIMKVWKYRMVACLIEIPDPKYSFFSRLTKFQRCMFRKIHWILTSPDNPTKNFVQ